MPPEPIVCNQTVHNNACIQTTVIVTPHVTIGTVNTFCDGDPVIGPCEGTVGLTCHFQVHQEVCVETPLTFFATAVTDATRIQCDTPEVGLCPQDTVG